MDNWLLAFTVRRVSILNINDPFVYVICSILGGDQFLMILLQFYRSKCDYLDESLDSIFYIANNFNQIYWKYQIFSFWICFSIWNNCLKFKIFKIKSELSIFM